jgi:uncharacterized membrane protein
MKRAKNILSPAASQKPVVRPVVTETETRPTASPNAEAEESNPTETANEKILADIAARRLAAQHNRAFSRSKLWLAEPVISFLVGGSIFWLLAINGLLYPLLGHSESGEAGNWLLLAILGAALLATVGITLSRYRRWSQSQLAGQPLEVAVQHLGWRMIAVLILGGLVVVVVFYGATALAPR